MIYVGRIERRRPYICVTSNTMHRLLIVASLIAAKYFEDVVYLNTLWADMGGLTVHELNALELDFLFAIDFDLAVSPTDYERCMTALSKFRFEERRVQAA